MRQRGTTGLIAIVFLVAACSNDDDSDESGSPNDGAASIKGVPVGTGLGANNGTTCDGSLRGRIRDFRMTFPDMEPAHSGKSDNAKDRGMVKPEIDATSRKPIYAGGATGTVTTTGPANFDKWFRDSSADNVGQELPLMFDGPDAKGVYSYDNQLFFPIDGQMWGNEGRDHNYSFTFELHTAFQYKGGEQFTFVGDDDVFTFINDKLVVDLGGVHEAETAVVNIDSLGLTKGNTYPLDFFFAERHVTESHFRIDTSLDFVDCGKMYLQ